MKVSIKHHCTLPTITCIYNLSGPNGCPRNESLPYPKLQREKGGWLLVRLTPADGVHLHTRLASCIPFGLQQLKEFVPSVALLLGHSTSVFQQDIEFLLVGTQPGRLAWLFEGIFRLLLPL